jgi:chromosome segregation ATPase
VWAELDDVSRARDVAREDAFELEALRREFGQLQRNRDELAGQVEEQRAKIRELSERSSDGADSESYEREMAVARQLIDGLEQQCQRAESRAAAYKTELVEMRAINSDLRTRLSAVGRRLSAGRSRSRSRDLSNR